MTYYMQYMGLLLFVPFFAACYVYSPKKFFVSVEEKNSRKAFEDGSWAVWIVFAFLAWMTHVNFNNNAAKWELCSIIDNYVREDQRPRHCIEVADAPEYD